LIFVIQENPVMRKFYGKAVIRLGLILSAMLAGSCSLFATHQRAAEITYRHLNGLTYEITLISYTYTPSPANAFRDFLLIDWGDGYSTEIPRVEKYDLPNAINITYNRYVGQHTFPGPSSYVISCEDPNRNGNIINIPNSINIPLFIYSELVISPFIGGYNNSPVLLIPPVDNGCVDEPFYHNPGAYDIDGDSLSYRLVPCLGSQGQVIPGYTLPAASHSIHLDSVSGDFYWDSPEQQGEFNIAILIEEWRNGVKIGSVLRDMQINIVVCDNKPPVIEALKDTCIEAGKTLTFDVRAYDPDSAKVTLTGTGGPMVLSDHPATLTPNPAIGLGHIKTTFNWPTICAHVHLQPYRMFFKASDNGSPVSLVDIKSMNIKVIGPAPKNLTATPSGNTITLAWDNYDCQNATGYYIYRKTDSTGYRPGYCETGVPPYLGYSLIDHLDDITRISYLDNNHGPGLYQGIKYCYMIVAFYPDKSESYASNEACTQLKKDRAVITNVSINTTSETQGSIYVAWSKPTEIDTIQAPGPYKYLLYRSVADVPGQFIVLDSLDNLNDTIFTDTLLNTKVYGYKYRVDLYNVTPGNRFLIGPSQDAPSLFITLAPTDHSVRIFWNNDVPWNNHFFTIYRQNAVTSSFDSIGTSTVPLYADTHLKNGTEYCYKIKSTGSYSESGFVDPILNYSQINCGIPVDNIFPCPPVLTVTPDCKNLIDTLTWKNGPDSCSADIVKYYIYYSPCISGQLSLTDSVVKGPLASATDSIYLHHVGTTVIGCYAMTAVDSVGHVSEFSNTFCVKYDSCNSAYELPNIFTPNGDLKNDLFVPIKRLPSIDHIEMTIVNRWGRVVFTTTDPEINWGGLDKNTHQPCADGVYFYTCDVYANSAECLPVKQTLQGSVTILR
jgi:gliding motility-associated-like protein